METTSTHPSELTEDDRYALRTLEKKTRFLVDENVHTEVVRYLRAHGWNVKSVDDVALRGHSDEDVLAFAHREDRILLTHDRDFLNDRQYPPNRNPGVVILTGGKGNDERLVTGLMDLLVTLAPYREILPNCKAVFHEDRTVAITLKDFHSGKLETMLFRLSPGQPVEVLSE